MMKTYVAARYKCTACDNRFATKRGRDSHYKMVHLGVDKPNKKERNIEPTSEERRLRLSDMQMDNR